MWDFTGNTCVRVEPSDKKQELEGVSDTGPIGEELMT